MSEHPSYGRGDPGDEDCGPHGFQIIRNGWIYAHRETLGSALALVRNVQRINGKNDCWKIMNGPTVEFSEKDL